MRIQPSTIIAGLFAAATLTGCGGGGSSSEETANLVNDPGSQKTQGDRTMPQQFAVAGQAYNFTADFTDLSGKSGLTYSVKNLPHWAFFDNTTGTINGIAAYGILEENVYPDVEILATDGQSTVTTQPFNIILVNESGKIAKNILVVSAHFAETAPQRPESDVRGSLDRIETYLETVSRQRLDPTLDHIEFGELPVALDTVKAWSETATFLRLAHESTNPAIGVACDLDATIPIAEDILRTEGDTWRSRYGYSITSLHLEFFRQPEVTNPCKDYSAGEIALRYIELPTDIDVNTYDVLMFDIYASQYNAGGFQSYLSEQDGLTQGGQPVIDKSYVVASSTAFNTSQSQRFAEFGGVTPSVAEVLSDYYTQGQIALTEWDRTAAHELIHAFGVGTHDNGFDVHTDDSLHTDIEKALKENNLYSTFNYGDWFSVMGASSYALGISPITQEFLGWLGDSRIHYIDRDQETVTIQEYNADSGFVAARIDVEGGRLYVTYRSGTQYDESLNHPKLIGNTQGLMVHFSEHRNPDQYQFLTTSVLLDMNGNPDDHVFTLTTGESYDLFNVRIDGVQISNGQAAFNVSY